MKRFVINDEKVNNSYGFKVLNSGISLERFNQNPVCLNDHRNTTKDTLGIWENLKSENGTLTGEPKFDTKDPDMMEVVRKVEAGILKGCSIGINFKHEDMKLVEGELTLTKCELMEVSICAVPSNASAITLYDETGNPLSAQEVKTLCLAAQTYNYNPENKMKKVLSHLQLSDAASEDAVLEAVQGIEAKLTTAKNDYNALKLKYDALESAEKTRLTTQLTAELDKAVKGGKLNATAKEKFLKMENPQDALDLLAELPERTSVEEELDKNKPDAKKYEKLSWDELHKGNKLAAVKTDFPDIYEQKFEEKFGYKPGEKK